MDFADPTEPAWAQNNPSPEAPDPVRSAFVMVVQIMQAGRASLLLKQEADRVLTIAAAVGIKTDLIETIRVEYGTGIAGIVADRGLSLLGRAVNNQTFLCLPIVTPKGIEGVLSLTDRMGGRQYTGTDLASTSFIAGHIGNLLEYRHESQVDFLSGLPNRKAFFETLQRELARNARSQREFAVVFIDVDKFKLVNDEQGHPAGDRLITAIGDALSRSIRQYDFAARLSGDEFGLILADTHDGETSLARRILARAGALRSLSVGIARYPHDGRTVEELMKAADDRMYQFKRSRSSDGAPAGRHTEPETGREVSDESAAAGGDRGPRQNA